MEARESGQDDRRPADSIIITAPHPLIREIPAQRYLAPRPLLARVVIVTVRGTWWMARYAIFLPLLFVRGPLMFVLGWFVALSIIGGLAALAFYAGPHRTYALLGILAVGLVATALRDGAYDAVLRWIDPRSSRG